MYKTIRHGENSLQYTILPQNDDFRMEGKLTSNSSNGGGAVAQGSKRGRRKSFFAYLGLIFVCTVIIGAILIPFLVTAECLPNPSDWFLRTKIVERGKPNNTIYQINNSHNKTESAIKLYLGYNQNEPQTTVGSDDAITIENIFSRPVPSNKKLQMKGADNFAEIPNNRVTTEIWNKKEAPVIITKSTELRTEKELVQSTTLSAAETTTIGTVKSVTSKKPVILPVLAKTNSVLKENGKLVTTQTEPENWIRSHWPFIDPSTYFQWAGYKSEDSVLLPVILGVTLIGMLLIVTLCLVGRNKKIIVTAVRKRNRNDIEEAGEDNTTLLTTGNLSDDE